MFGEAWVKSKKVALKSFSRNYPFNTMLRYTKPKQLYPSCMTPLLYSLQYFSKTDIRWHHSEMINTLTKLQWIWFSLYITSWHITLLQRSSNVILMLWTLNGRCFDVECQLGTMSLLRANHTFQNGKVCIEITGLHVKKNTIYMVLKYRIV